MRRKALRLVPTRNLFDTRSCVSMANVPTLLVALVLAKWISVMGAC